MNKKPFGNAVFLILMLFLALLFPTKNYSQTYIPVAVTGFDADGIAETPPNSLTTTTYAMDNSNSAMYSQTFAAGCGIAGGIINTGTIVSGTRTYQLQPFNTNNVIMDTNGSVKIMTITTPAQFTKISVLGFSTEGASSVTFVLHFTDGTIVNAGSVNILDWFTGTGNVYNGFGKCPRVANVNSTIGPPNNPNFYPFDINIPCADQLKLLDKITFINTGGQFGYTKACFLALSAVPYSLTITPTITNVLCFGAHTGNVSLAVNGNSNPYTYLWSNGQNTDPAINLAAGTYTCTVTDANGCTSTVSETVTQPNAAVTATITNHVNANCGALGSATVSGAGGTGNLTYSWNTIPVQTTTTAVNLTGGTYTVTVTDANGCTATAQITITQTNAISASITAQTNVLCFGGSTGSATVTATGSNGYTYSWNTIPVQTTQTAINLSVGTYSVTVTDVNGCTAATTVTITQPATAVSVTITNVVNATCSTLGSATASGTGGTGNITYSWNTIPVQTTATATNLGAGTFLVTVTDANGCTALDSATITQTNGITAVISSQVNVLCFGGNTGTATVTPNGGNGYTYNWNTAPVQTTQTAVNLTSGTYSVTVTSGNGCTAVASVTITEPGSALTSSITSQTNVLCNGDNTGSATALGAGGTANYTYLWSNAQNTQTATNLIAGNYIVTVTDANGCTTTTNVTISQPANPLTATITAQTNITCGAGNGTATVTAAGGTGNDTYSWLTVPVQTTATATNLPAGTYLVTVTDANGCTATTTVTITQTNGITDTITSQTNVLCFGGNTGSATITATGGNGYSYNWNTTPVQTTATANGLLAGTYFVTVTAANGCTATDSVIITQPGSSLTASITAQTNVLCNGSSSGTATAQGAGGTANYIYLWSNAQNTQTANNLGAGNFIVTVTDANGCTTTTNVTITQPNALTATISSQTNVSACNGTNGSATVTAAGGTGIITYNWNTNPAQTTATASNLGGGAYIVTVTDGNGCTATATVTITQPTAMVLTVSSNVIICTGQSTTLTVAVTGGSSPFTYVWNPGGPGGSSLTVSPGTTTSYTVSVTDASGCNIVSPAITVTVGSAPTALFSATPVSGCSPLTVDFTDQSTVGVGTITSWAWVFGDNNSSSLQNPSNTYLPGLYSVSLTVTSTSGCSATYSMHNIIDVYPNPLANFTASTYHTTDLTGNINFYDESSNANSWTWDFGDGTSANSTGTGKDPDHNYQTAGIFTVTEWVTNIYGCVDSISKTIFIDADFEFYIPTAFTPNNDNKNEVFTGVGNNITSFQMQIFNRWGENIFTTNDISQGWNGKANGTGELLKQDIYVYNIRVLDFYGVEHKYNGRVTLIR